MDLLFDIGGTKMRLAVSHDGRSVENVQIYETPPVFEDSIPIFQEYISTLSNTVINKVSGALPGIFNEDNSQILKCKNLEGWVGKPIKSEFERIFNSKVILSNDAKMAGLGEAVHGAGKEYKVTAYLTISTGVGGARIVEGKLNDDTLKLEPGHQIIDLDSSISPGFLKENDRYDYKVATLERLVSGKDLSLKYNKPLEEISDDEVWNEIAKYLSVGINNVIVFWMPDVVVLGGGVAMSSNLKVDMIERYLKDYLTLAIKPPKIKKAELGDNSALYGALEYVKTKVV